MQRLRICDLEIAQGEIYADGDLHFPSICEVFDQTWLHIHVKLFELQFTSYFAFAIFDLYFFFSLREHLNVTSGASHATIHLIGTTI